MKKIIALTGSFNPVTKAHYTILSDAVEKFNADEGVFIATTNKYLNKKVLTKRKSDINFILPDELRIKMLSSLSMENPKLSFWGFEIGGTDPSTYKTLKKLAKDKQKQYPGEEIELYYLCGGDKLRSISHWKNAEEMATTFEYIVYDRNFDLEAVVANDPFLIKHRDRIHFMEIDDENIENVSSTELRRRFFAGADYRALMNEGPYNLMQQLDPADFPPVTDEDIIKAQILYGGMHGKGNARLHVYKTNCEVFRAWQESWLGNRDEHRVGKVYDSEFTVNVPKQPKATVTGCVNADCVDVARELLEEGLCPAILNLASRTSPGGGYHKGTSAQEESLCYASTLSQSLYAFGNPKYKHIRESGVANVPGVYPLDLNFGGVYSPCVTFFRRNEKNYYALRTENEIFDCPVVTVASLSNREKNEYNTYDERTYFDNTGYLTVAGKEIELNKIRTIFRIALDNGRDSMVLGAFGCGVYNLRCDEVSALFRDVLSEPEFDNRFKKIVFAIYEGKPTRKKPDKGENGKFKPFYDLFK